MKYKTITLISILLFSTCLSTNIFTFNASSENEFCNNDSTYISKNYTDCLAISPDDNIIVGGGRGGEIYILDPVKMKPIKELSAHSDMVSTVEFSRDGRYLASGSFDGTVKIWRVADWRCMETFTTNITRVIEVKFTNNGTWLIALFYDHSDMLTDPIIEIYSIGDWVEIKNFTIEIGWGFNSMTISNDNRLIAVGAIKRFLVFDTLTWEMQEIQFETHSIENQVAFSPNCRYLACGHEEISIYSTINWQVQINLSRNGSISSVDFSVDSRYLAASYLEEEPDYTIWETETWSKVQDLIPPSGTAGTGVKFANNNDFFAGSHGGITTWQFDSDRDGILDGTDPDDDNDGINDTGDPVPKDPSQWEDADGDGFGDNSSGNNSDVFPNDPTQWSDIDGDGYGDNIDGNDPDMFPYDPTRWEDLDGDGYNESIDQFPFDGSEWKDSDGDGIGDNADQDDDNDGYADIYELTDGTDPFDNNSVPADFDNDFIPDSSDIDDDNDGVLDDKDAFPLDPYEWSDTDSDGIGDNSDDDLDGDGYNNSIDVFPHDADEWSDLDSNGLGDNSDPDIDGDGYLNEEDKFPYDVNEWSDTDGDGTGDNSDTDDDGDGVLDVNDIFPLDPAENSDFDGDGIGDNADPDDDSDGYNDSIEVSEASDPFNSSSVPNDLDSDKIPDSIDPDIDGDEVPNEDDEFPFDSSKSEAEPEFDFTPLIFTLVGIVIIILLLVGLVTYIKRQKR
jgi:WD40 repeat protein